MSIKENVSIPVLNYNESNVCIPTNISTHILPPAVDGVPSVDYLSFAEINYVNGISDCFRTGMVRFDDNDKILTASGDVEPTPNYAANALNEFMKVTSTTIEKK